MEKEALSMESDCDSGCTVVPWCASVAIGSKLRIVVTGHEPLKEKPVPDYPGYLTANGSSLASYTVQLNFAFL